MAKRPFLPVALCFAAGVLAADMISFWLPGLFILAFVLALACLCWEAKRGLLLWLLLVCAGGVRQSLDLQPLSPIDLRLIESGKDELVTVLGRLRETPRERLTVIRGRQTWRSKGVLQVEGIARGDQIQKAAGLVVAQAGDLLPSDFFAGRAVAISGVLKSPPGALAEAMFDYRSYLRRQNIYFELDARETNSWSVRWEAKQPSRPPLGDRFVAWSRKILALGLTEEDVPMRLDFAMALDAKGALTEDVVEPFLRAGTYHIFAVDGLRIGLISGIFLGLFRAGRIPKTAAGLMVIPILWFYAATTGWAASAIRATVMMSVILAGWSVRRPSDLLNSMCAAACLILAWQPQQLFQAGFQLSFVVVVCIALLSPVLRRIEFRRPDPLAPPSPPAFPAWFLTVSRYLKEILLASIVAWLGSIPLTAYYFNLFSLASVPGNVLVVPVCVLCLICNLLSLLTGALLPGIAILFNNAAWLLMKVIALASAWTAALPAGYFYVASPSLVSIILYYLVLLTILTGWLFSFSRKKWVFAFIALLSGAWLCQKWEARRTDSLYVLSDRGSEILFLSTPNSAETMLVNAGRSNTVERLIKPFLRAHGVNRLPFLLLTHGDAPHAGGLKPIEAEFRPLLELSGPARARSSAFDALRAESRQGKAHWEEITTDAHAGPWAVLYPPAAPRPARSQDDAVVLRGDFNGARVLALSNLGWVGQRALLARQIDLHVDILIASIPSGGEAVSDSLLTAVHPALIILDDGEPGSAMHAPEALRSRLEARHECVIWFHETGSIKLEFKPGLWKAVSADGREVARQSK